MEKLEQKISQFTFILSLGILSSLLLSILVVYNSMIGVVAPIVLVFGIAIGILIVLVFQGIFKMIAGRKNRAHAVTKRVKAKKTPKIKPNSINKNREYEDEDYEEDDEYGDYDDEDLDEDEIDEDMEFDYEEDDYEDPIPAPKHKKQPKNKR